jgi:hypothetical protein
MSAKREEAEKILNEIPKTPEGIRSDTRPELFQRWTGYKHTDLMEHWRKYKHLAKGPLLTACGGFASAFGGRMGITDINSYFDLEKSLTEAGKPHAWVPASSGAKPQLGDILRHTVFHADVAAGWDGGKLKRVAAGQSSHPRPRESVEDEFDALKWVTGSATYNPINLQGWLDLDKYFGPATPVPAKTIITPEWLFGWWTVTWRGQTFTYHFYRDGSVIWTQNIKQPASSGGMGKFSVDYSGKIVVQWESGSVETFTKGASTREIRGTWIGKDGSQAPITAKK